jgi:Fur family ferric uptake transcriptional regulator
MTARPHAHGEGRAAAAAGPAPPAAPTAAAWAVFVTFLKARCARVTTARKTVLVRVLARSDHFRADELVEDLAAGARRVSRGTVYRTLALLVAAGLVREIRDRDVHVHYESCFGRDHHEHLICDVCGRFIEFADADLERRIAVAAEAHRFQPRSHRVAIFGTCARCDGGR